VDNISLSWDLPPGLSVKMLSPEQLTIFRGQRLIIYAQLTGLMPVSPYPYSFFSFFFLSRYYICAFINTWWSLGISAFAQQPGTHPLLGAMAKCSVLSLTYC
jgi:hypothetical protein